MPRIRKFKKNLNLSKSGNSNNYLKLLNRYNNFQVCNMRDSDENRQSKKTSGCITLCVRIVPLLFFQPVGIQFYVHNFSVVDTGLICGGKIT